MLEPVAKLRTKFATKFATKLDALNIPVQQPTMHPRRGRHFSFNR